MSRYVLAATGWCIWFGMTVSYFYMTYPGWMWSYIIDEGKLSLPLSFGLFWLTLAVAGFSGAVVAQELIKARKTALLSAIVVYAVAVFAAVMGFLSTEYAHVGTYAQFHAGQALPMQGHPIQGPMTIAGICEAIPALALVAWYMTSGRKAKGQPAGA
ncbi:MAG: hypothetical protein H7338_16335 [Candidatus Sericytochromatia bacterium]|nr:hypothetical protein [Candidatus Sericytochromatia bacterium]